MNILIVKLSAIGDIIHTLPSLIELRRLYPEAHITWVVEEAAADQLLIEAFKNTSLARQRAPLAWQRAAAHLANKGSHGRIEALRPEHLRGACGFEGSM